MTAPSGIASMNYTDLQGRTVYGNDGSKLGKIADLYDDDSGGAPVFATVNTGLFGSKTTFVPMTQAQIQGDDVVVPYSKDQVKGAPSIEADAEISPRRSRRSSPTTASAAAGARARPARRDSAPRSPPATRRPGPQVRRRTVTATASRTVRSVGSTPRPARAPSATTPPAPRPTRP